MSVGLFRRWLPSRGSAGCLHWHSSPESANSQHRAATGPRPLRQTGQVPLDLTTAAGRATLDAAVSLISPPAGNGPADDPVRRAAQLRTRLEPELAAAALTQAALRQRAMAKFGARAASLYFTAAGLEQATRAEVAAHRAQRFADAGLGSVLDLCCGIGADALAFAEAGLVVHAVDRDPEAAAMAVANTVGLPVTVAVAEAEEVDRRAAAAVFCDPGRREGGRRTFDPAAYSPPFSFVLELVAGSLPAAAKLGPGLDHALIPAGVEAEWVSFAGGVKEAVLWSAGLCSAEVTRRATVLPAGVQLTDADPANDRVGPIGDYVYEPDGAVIRAGLVQQAAAVLGGHRIDEHLAYLSSDRPASSALARGFAVRAVLPYSMRRLRAELRAREVGVVEIKKRGVDIDPARLRSELRPSGPNSLTVLLARVGDQRLAVLADPLPR
jgi:SAM-dependent methyltransferase